MYVYLGNAGFLGLADWAEGQEVIEKKNGTSVEAQGERGRRYVA